MRLIGLAVVVAVNLILAPLAAVAQQQVGKTYRIGFLRYLGCAEQGHFTELRQGLRDLGYAEGHNLVIECRAAPGKAERISALAAELVRLNVDVIVAEGTVSALAAKQATRTIPIVMVYVADPVASGSRGKPFGDVDLLDSSPGYGAHQQSRLDQTSATPQACRFKSCTLCGPAERGRWRRRRGVRASWTYACDTFADRIAKRAART